MDVVARALAVLLVERHGVAVGHDGRARLEGLRGVDAGTAILEIFPVELEAFLFLLLLDLHGGFSGADAKAAPWYCIVRSSGGLVVQRNFLELISVCKPALGSSVSVEADPVNLKSEQEASPPKLHGASIQNRHQIQQPRPVRTNLQLS